MAKSKRKYSINVTAIICAVIIAVAGVLITLVGVGSSWFKNADVTTWFGGWGKKKTEAVLALASDGDELKDGTVCDLTRGITYLFTTRAEMTDEGITETDYIPDGEITVTAELSNPLINGKFDWSVSFANSSAEWASDKNAADYVSVTPIIDGSNTAKLKFLQVFNEQIILTATDRGSDNLESCTVDCLKNVDYDVSSMNIGGTDFHDGAEFCICYNYGAGTVSGGDFKLKSFRVEVSNTFITAFKNYLKFDVEVTPCDFNTTEWTANFYESALPNGAGLATGVGFESGHTFLMSDFITDFNNYDEAHKEAIYYAWYNAWKTNKYNVLISFSLEYVYAGYTVSTYSETDINNSLWLTGEVDGYEVSPNVTLNKNYVF